MDPKPYTAAQVQLFKLAYRTSEAVNRALNTQQDSMIAWLKTQYGGTAPTYEQFWSDRDALKLLAQEKGLVDDQWVRKPYNAAVKVLYGDIPASPTLEAVAKRAQRPQVAKLASLAAGKAANEPSLKVYKVEMPKTAVDAVRQMLARYGFGQVLMAFSTILAEHRETAKEAKRMDVLAQEYQRIHPENQRNGTGAVIH